MKSPSLPILQQLATKIHPPLPLNPRESQKLLSLLKASFRKQLDHEHGYGSSNRSTITETHLKSILTSPLFDNISHHMNVPEGGQLRGHGPTQSLKDIRLMTRDPVETFRCHVATGSVSLEIAKECLRCYLNKMKTPGRPDSIDQGSAVSMSDLIEHWLWASGVEKEIEFMQDQRFLGLSVAALVLEHRERHALKWLTRLRPELHEFSLDQPWGEDAERRMRTQAMIVKILSAAQIKYGIGLNGGLKSFLTALTKMTSPKSLDKNYTYRIFRPTALYLMRRLIITNTDVVADPCLSKEFCQSARWWSRNAIFDSVRLSLLRHPFPDPYPALLYIRELAIATPPPYKARRDVMSLCLKTADILLQKDDSKNAKWLLEYLQANFPEEIGQEVLRAAPSTSAQEQGTSMETETAMSLRQLDALALG
jgi:hypothetical protein